MMQVKAIDVNTDLMDALDEAERFAQKNTGRTYSVFEQAGKFSCISDAMQAPENSSLITTVTRNPAPDYASLRSITQQVLSNLPDDIELSKEAVIEFYSQGSVHAYQFMSTEGRNVATWMPISNSALMQMGFDGRGRPWKDGTTNKDHVTDISGYFTEKSVERPGN